MTLVFGSDEANRIAKQMRRLEAEDGQGATFVPDEEAVPFMLPTPTGYSYIGREECGCCTFLTSDQGRPEMYAELAKLRREGVAIERLPTDVVRKAVFEEPTFMNCPHRVRGA